MRPCRATRSLLRVRAVAATCHTYCAAALPRPSKARYETTMKTLQARANAPAKAAPSPCLHSVQRRGTGKKTQRRAGRSPSPPLEASRRTPGGLRGLASVLQAASSILAGKKRAVNWLFGIVSRISIQRLHSIAAADRERRSKSAHRDPARGARQSPRASKHHDPQHRRDLGRGLRRAQPPATDARDHADAKFY